jgi:uncharacterized protein YaaQ
MGIPTTRLASSIGAQGRPSTTILMGVEEDQVHTVVQALIDTAEQTPEFRRGPFNLLPGGGQEEEVQVGNATVAVFNVEHYEEI